jgi:hypothetical protein
MPAPAAEKRWTHSAGETGEEGTDLVVLNLSGPVQQRNFR